MFTFTPPKLLRKLADRSLRVIAFALSAFVFAFAVRLAWLAFTDPLEIEIREGSVWLHALAKRAGVDIYDTGRVAFVNMNHGPLDPILKGWIARLAPALPGHMVTRTFVLLAPVILFAAACSVSRRLTAAMLAGGALFLFFCHLSWMVYVGRSDATAVCAFAVCGALAHRLLVSRHRSWSSKPYIATQIGLGAASAAVFMTSWRYAPIVVALQLVVASTQFAEWKSDGLPTMRPVVWLLERLLVVAKHAAIGTAFYVAGFAALWLPVFLFELHGDLEAYYRHFFGFFVADNSGWGTFAGTSFNVVPSELFLSRRTSIYAFLVLILFGLYRLRKQRAELVAWVMVLSSAWLAVSYGYFKNRGGGGMHYFFEFFAFAWIFVLHALFQGRRLRPLIQFVLVIAVVLALPRKDLRAQHTMLVDVRKRAREFRDDLAGLAHGERVFGEETHLFKRRYQGDRVDTGDTDAAIAASGYFGEAFTRTYAAYVQDLTSNPPKFIVGGLLPGSNPEFIMSAPLQDLLQRRYTLRRTAQGTSFVNGASQGLFERND